jgi:AraC-like DNA-binding protein
MCPLGFIFWASPVYSGGHRAGTLISGGVIGTDRRELSEKIYALCKKETTMDLIEKNLAEVPERSYEDIKALAQIMMLCAEQISRPGEDYSEEQKAGAEIRLIRNDPAGESPPPNDLPEKERLLLASLRRGDIGTGKKILNDIIPICICISAGNFELFQIQAIELVVLLSRASKGHKSLHGMMEASDRCLKRIEESKSTEKLIGNLYIIIEYMGEKIFSFRGIRHASALRKAERFIQKNYIRKISLQEIAAASGLSAPYFSTIFKEEMGENLSVYLNRLRVEKAAAMLIETETALCEISEACGFEDQSWFSKIFKNYMGLSPGKYRERGGPSLEHYAG